MSFLFKSLREVAYAIGVFVVGMIGGVIAYHIFLLIAVSAGMEHIDGGRDAVNGAGMLIGFMVLLIHLAVRIFRRKKPA